MIEREIASRICTAVRDYCGTNSAPQEYYACARLVIGFLQNLPSYFRDSYIAASFLEAVASMLTGCT